MMQIHISPANEGQRRPKPQDEDNLVFGKHFSDHMFLMDYDIDKGWHNARIIPYGNLSLDPAAMVLHYGQGIFEGLKAYRCADGTIQLFRPDKNFERFNRSARRMCMPEIDPEVQMQVLETLLKVDADWVPRKRGTSLYIRPTMIAVEPALGVTPAHQ
jgi:branched-chain amino acid aminotransferase